jgi:hypothetical protein
MLEILQNVSQVREKQLNATQPYYYRKVLDCSCAGGYQEYIRDTCRPVTKPAPAVPSPSYSFSHAELMRRRCQTIEQKSYNFVQSQDSTTEFRSAGCPDGCNITTYKPNNTKFSTQGAVSSSARMMRLKYDTVASARETYKTYTATNEIVRDTVCKPVYVNGRRVYCR